MFESTYFEEHLRTTASLPVKFRNHNNFLYFTVFLSVANDLRISYTISFSVFSRYTSSKQSIHAYNALNFEYVDIVVIKVPNYQRQTDLTFSHWQWENKHAQQQ